ncbi:MAG TPA: hypothetical protein VGL01_16375 [Trinickia sp.]|jgi:hypothetical protein|uniref:hypothetical protein n=1 Tax=Trinickia sp. TaxID=2571163 RepID=UPI002F3FB32B
MLNFEIKLDAHAARHLNVRGGCAAGYAAGDADLARIGSHRQHNKTNNDNYDQKTSRGNTNNIAAHLKQLPAFSKEP